MKEFVFMSGELQLILAGLRASREEHLMNIEAIKAGPDNQWWRIASLETVSKQTLELIQSLLTGWNTKGKGICPVCNGFGLVRISPDSRKWYPTEHFHKCTNCGGQYQDGITHLNLGMVNLRRDNGEPCKHEYTYTKLGNCYHGYTCKHCGDSHTVDSGD